MGLEVERATLADALRRRRAQVATRWRRLTVGRQALLVLAHLPKGETCTDLAADVVDTVYEGW